MSGFGELFATAVFAFFAGLVMGYGQGVSSSAPMVSFLTGGGF